MAAKDIDIKLKLDAKQADKDLKGIKDDLDELGDKPTEIEVKADTEAAETDLKTLDELSDRLEANPTVIEIKADIDAAKADLDSLDTKLHDLDDASAATGTKIGKDIGDGAGEARGRMSELVGESVAELPGIGAALGPAGEALSSLTEGFLGGELALKDLVLAGGGMAAVTLAFKVLSSAMEANKRIDAFNKKKVDDFTEALREGKTALQQLNDEFEDTGRVEFVDAADGNIKDLIGTLADSDISWDDFITNVSKGKEGFKEWVIAAGPAIGAGADLNAIIQAGNQYIDDAAVATKAYADQQEVMGITAAEAAREHRGLENAVVDGTAAMKKAETPIRNAAHEVDEFAENSSKADLAYRRLIGILDEQEAWETVNADIIEYNKNTKHSEEETRNHIRAIADYVIETDTIPETKKTEILAALREGDIAKAEAELAALTRQRDIKILLTAVGSQDIIEKLGQKGVRTMAGGPVYAGKAYTVGDGTGPETFVPSENGVILPHGQELVGTAVGGPVYITNNFPPGISPTAVARANKEYHRRGGR